MPRKHDEIPVAAGRNDGHYTPGMTAIAEAFLNPEWKFSCSNIRPLCRCNKSNAVVCEVKGKLNTKDPRGVLKDLDTLLIYTQKYQYKAGVFILYNHQLDELKAFLKKHENRIRVSSAHDKIHLIAVDSAILRDNPISLADALAQVIHAKRRRPPHRQQRPGGELQEHHYHHDLEHGGRHYPEEF